MWNSKLWFAASLKTSANNFFPLLTCNRKARNLLNRICEEGKIPESLVRILDCNVFITFGKNHWCHLSTLINSFWAGQWCAIKVNKNFRIIVCCLYYTVSFSQPGCFDILCFPEVLVTMCIKWLKHVQCQNFHKTLIKCGHYLLQMSLPVVAPGEQVIEMMIPASKVGLIIGKFK